MSDNDRSGSVWAVAIVFAVLSWLTVSLRVYVRVEQIGTFGLDDKLVIIAQIFFTGYLICQMGGAAYGTGRRLAILEQWSAETALRFWFFCELWYSLANTAVKLAICLSLRRVTIRPIHSLIIYGLMIWSVALGLAFFLGIIFQCRPPSDWWSLDPDEKHCLPPHIVTSLTYAISAINVACDWSLGLFPFVIVRDLSLPLHQKIMVASILAFGAIASTATLVRVFYINTLEQTYRGWNGDFLYDTTPVAIWSTVEVGVGITAICLATLRPLVTAFMRRIRPSTHDSHSHRYQRRRHSHESPPPIPLVLNPHTGLPDYAHTERNLQGSYDQYAGVDRYNATKPLDASITSVTEADEDVYYKASSSRMNHTLNATRFNPTKALTSSYGDSDDEIYPIKPVVRRAGGPP